jgi:ABC-2 type transport system ATP-binding protein
VDGGRVIARGAPAGLKSRLGSTVIEITLPDEAYATRAQAVLDPLAQGRPEREGSTVRITSDDGARFLMEVLRALDAQDLDPGGLTVREPSLDDVFLALTGRHAEPVVPDREVAPVGGAA